MQQAENSRCAEDSICEACVRDNPTAGILAQDDKEVLTSERKRPDDTEGGSCD